MTITSTDLSAFEESTLVGTYLPKVAEFTSAAPRLGLNSQIMYIYGGGRAADGSLQVVQRKFLASMTGGLFLMGSQDGALQLLPGSPRSARGEVRRTRTDQEIRWFEPLMQRIPEEIRIAEEQPIDLSFTENGIRWQEGDLLDLTGTLASAGVKLFCSVQDNSWLYTSHPYRVQGTIAGKEIDGVVFMDWVFFQPHGAEWKETPFYTEREVFWNVFANVFEDGTTQFGHLVRGTGGLDFAAIVEGKDVVALSDRIAVTAEIDDDYVSRADYVVDGIDLEYTAVPGGRMDGHSKARWAGYRSQSGQVRVKGDNRKIVTGFSWMESFADRIRDEGIVR